LTELEAESQDIENRPISNIPSQFLRFRKGLANYLDVNENALPFLAELAQVKPKAST
jgi:uncharacterized protein YPO0396